MGILIVRGTILNHMGLHCLYISVSLEGYYDGWWLRGPATAGENLGKEFSAVRTDTLKYHNANRTYGFANPLLLLPQMILGEDPPAPIQVDVLEDRL